MPRRGEFLSGIRNTLPILAGVAPPNYGGKLFDLLPLVQQHYYHPEMKGSWSIKSVLPTLAPELSYENLNLIRDGFAAQQAFEELREGTFLKKSAA